MSKVAELPQNPKAYTSHMSRFARQETGSDLTKIVRKCFQVYIIVASPVNASLQGKLRHSRGDKSQCVLETMKLLTNHPKPQQWRSRPPQTRNSCTGWAEVFPHRSPATCNAKGHLEMGVEENGGGGGGWKERQKMGGNLSSGQESLRRWKPQTRARLRSQEVSCWGLRKWAGIIAMTRSRKGLRVISGHGRLKENQSMYDCSLFA